MINTLSGGQFTKFGLGKFWNEEEVGYLLKVEQKKVYLSSLYSTVWPPSAN